VTSDKNVEFVAGDYLQFKFVTEGIEECLKLTKKGKETVRKMS